MIYLIGGAIRTGKSALANKILQEKQISIISTDIIIGLLVDFVKPQDQGDTRLYIVKKAENFFPHLKKMIQTNTALGNKNFIYEGDIILPEYVSELSEKYEFKACFLGFSKITVEQLKKHTGNHQWLDELTEEKLNDLPERIINDSEYIEKECKKYGLEYFDLSVGYEEKINEAYQYLTN